MKSIDVPQDRNRGNSYVAGMEMVTRLMTVRVPRPVLDALMFATR